MKLTTASAQSMRLVVALAKTGSTLRYNPLSATYLLATGRDRSAIGLYPSIRDHFFCRLLEGFGWVDCLARTHLESIICGKWKKRSAKVNR